MSFVDVLRDASVHVTPSQVQDTSDFRDRLMVDIGMQQNIQVINILSEFEGVTFSLLLTTQRQI